MTLAEQLIAEGKYKGRLEGMHEGELKGKLEVAGRLLSEGVEIAFVVKMTGISIERLKTLQEELS
jgi:predicted transposase/invertase (TIGR01784 family)